ncbi:signal peptidase I [Alcanivorax sp. N3-2A]|nr:signal peptidase I [Alcanivorax sp. N3-2A]|tara:strand:- start:15827 stop:16594 length:768 start_codon:yes stop_codon:yes gene_type:complete
MPNRWFAGVVGFFLPPLAFLYLSRGRWALFYLLVVVLVTLLDNALLARGYPAGVGLLLALAGAVHAFRVAGKAPAWAPRRWFNRWWGALAIPLVLVGVLLLVRGFVVDYFSIPSASMSPTLEPGDHVLISKLGADQPQRGEVFVLIPPRQPDTLFIERVIGLPGDRLRFSDKQWVINGTPVATDKQGGQRYRETLGGHSYTVLYLADWSPGREVDVTVPQGHYFMVGDNRDNANDSRYWGMVPARNMVGRMVGHW